ncbi:MAG: hypothetical protein JSS95_12810 [Acidobacteria bacterium]|nr:hypothetical protein [Acidobacteriota bacterium]
MSRLKATVLIAALGAPLMMGQSSPNAELPAGAAKQKAEGACLTCHDARIIVQQRLPKGAWVKELDKMTNWGAPVDPKDRDALVDYFSANFGPDQPAYDAPRTAADKKTEAKIKRSTHGQ